jgi:hypothetical protein
VKLDCEYIDNWSLWLDAKIVAKTVTKMVRGDAWQRASGCGLKNGLPMPREAGIIPSARRNQREGHYGPRPRRRGPSHTGQRHPVDC